MKGVLYYFSGTGNTMWVANKIKENFRYYGVDISLINMESEQPINIKCYDFMIIGSPVHFGTEPKIVSNFFRKLPNVKKKIKTIVYSTQSGKSSSAVLSMAKSLTEKGYDIFIQTSIKMPNNRYFILGKKSSLEEESQVLIKSSEKVKKVIKLFMENKRLKECNSNIRMKFGRVYGKFLRNSLPRVSKNITSSEECMKCGLCLRNCPKSNITFENGHAIFHSQCMLCLRCIYICPINAIRYKGKKIDQIQKNRIKMLNLIK
ncbi:EFR1 family ferrodoxin [Clostridium thailandense]|uniref:EFR1 family ferrodoxin n=1 Tax=Clostridium thailandense TaxID=2794346 RepID=UPI00398922CD